MDYSDNVLLAYLVFRQKPFDSIDFDIVADILSTYDKAVSSH